MQLDIAMIGTELIVIVLQRIEFVARQNNTQIYHKYAGQIINITLLEMQDKNSVNYKDSFELKLKQEMQDKNINNTLLEMQDKNSVNY